MTQTGKGWPPAATVLVRTAPGATYPAHRHGGVVSCRRDEILERRA